VDAVIEVDETGQVVDSSPLDRAAGPEALTDRVRDGAVGQDLRVTVHAGLCGREAGERGLLNRGVAISAVDPVIADMVFMAERHRLLASDPNLCHVG